MLPVRTRFGDTREGRPVEAVTLAGSAGLEATVITYGATLQSLRIADRAGMLADVALGYSDMTGYEANSGYFGATVGRVANRIAGGRFTLDGQTFQLDRNDNGVAALHGGTCGFDKAVWEIVAMAESPQSVTLRHASADGDQGYPGRLTATVTYALDHAGALTIDFGATCDRATIVNLTNHSMYNMAGEGAPAGAMGNLLRIDADGYTPVDKDLIPTGEVRAVAGSAFDFRCPTAVGARIRDGGEDQLRIALGYDHNFVLDAAAGAAPRLVARLEDPVSGRAMEILSDQPGLQFYSGNFLDGTHLGKSGRFYRQGDGIALEPQHFPDTPNQPAFGSIRLEPGQQYRNRMVLRAASRR